MTFFLNRTTSLVMVEFAYASLIFTSLNDIQLLVWFVWIPSISTGPLLLILSHSSIYWPWLDVLTSILLLSELISMP